MPGRGRLALLVGLFLVAPGQAAAADPIMPLREVRPGADCVGLTVVRGTAISEFDVDVIDVLAGDTEAAARILVRLSGPPVDASGLAEGMSGSPVMCRDGSGPRRNAGALSETIGEYGDDVALATPIEEILGEPVDPPPGARRAAPLLRRGRPLATPLTVGGLSGRVRRALGRAARRAGRTVIPAPAGPLASFPPQELRPGASVAAGLSSGDVPLSAIGTVAYRDGSAVWAFGHPLDAAGRRSLPLQDAYVFTVINNPLTLEEATSYKLAAPGHTLGTLTNDALGSVVGRIGPAPATIPLTVTASDVGSNRLDRSRSLVADERSLGLGTGLPLAGALAMADVTSTVLRGAPPRLASSLCLRITVRQRRRPLGFCNHYFDAVGPLHDFGAAARLLEGYRFGRLDVTDVSARLRLRRDRPEALLLRGRARGGVRPGRRARIRVVVRREGGGLARLSFRMRIPRSLRPGRRVLRLTGDRPRPLDEGLEGELAELFSDQGAGRGDAVGVRSLRQLAARIAALGRPRGVRGTFGRRGRGPVVLRTEALRVRGVVRIPVRVLGRARG